MEDIIEEFGKGFLSIGAGMFFFIFLHKSMSVGGTLYDMVLWFMNGICGY